MDGANMNAQVGLCRPGDIGADVCHLNLHKTFCIPHGGGGPGMGPIARRGAPRAVPARPSGGRRRAASRRSAPVSAAPWGSASILPISWAYIAMMGADGPAPRDRGRDPQRELHRASGSSAHFPVALHGQAAAASRTSASSTCARSRRRAGIEVEDIAKRLMDYGFHAPTMSFPVAGHADGRADRERVEGRARSVLRRDDRDPRGDRARSRRARWPREDNPLKNAPHTAAALLADRVDAPVHARARGVPRAVDCASTSSGRRSGASTTCSATATWSAPARIFPRTSRPQRPGPSPRPSPSPRPKAPAPCPSFIVFRSSFLIPRSSSRPKAASQRCGSSVAS